jgi:uncharacterized membrane protein
MRDAPKSSAKSKDRAPNSDLIAGVILALFGVLMLFVLIPSQTSAGGDATISPALLPYICSIGITGLAMLLIARAAGRLRRGQPAGESVPNAEWIAAGVVIVFVSAAVAIFKLVNPAVAAGLLIVSLMLFMAERRIWLLVGIPGVLLFGAWVLFYRVLGTAIA